MFMNFRTMLWISTLIASQGLWAQDTDWGFSAGQQEVDVKGNEQVYRTQIDENSGFLLRDFYYNVSDTEGKIDWFDHFRVDASGFGGAPHGRLKLSMKDAESYSLKLKYRRFSHFNLLPAYANPLFDEGITPGQHGLDRTRENLDFQLSLRPQARIRPIFGLRYHDSNGPGLTTFSIGGDEFRLDSQSDETSRELYGGFTFVAKNWRGELAHGVREYEGREAHVLTQGAGDGNSTRILFGEEINLQDLNRTDRVDTRTPITRFHVTGRPSEKLNVLTSFVHADLETDAHTSESLQGNLLSFRLRGFFGGRDQAIKSTAKTPSWRGDVRLEYRPNARLGLDAAVMRRHREMDGLALLSSVFTDVVNFGGSPVDDFAELVESNSFWEREETSYEGRLTFYAKDNMGLWTSFATTDNDSLIVADESDIVIPIGQDGHFQRKVDKLGLGGYFNHEKIKLKAKWQRQDADEMVFRSDFLERDNFALKVKFSPFKKLNLNGSYKRSEYRNNTTDIALDGSDESLDLGLDFTHKTFHLHLGYGDYELDNAILIRIPQTLQYESSQHMEDGSSYEAYLDWSIQKKHSLMLNVSHHENEGALPFEMDLARLSARAQLKKSLELILEASKREYQEIELPIADYEADTYGIFLRWMP